MSRKESIQELHKRLAKEQAIEPSEAGILKGLVNLLSYSPYKEGEVIGASPDDLSGLLVGGASLGAAPVITSKILEKGGKLAEVLRSMRRARPLPKGGFGEVAEQGAIAPKYAGRELKALKSEVERDLAKEVSTSKPKTTKLSKAESDLPEYDWLGGELPLAEEETIRLASKSPEEFRRRLASARLRDRRTDDLLNELEDNEINRLMTSDDTGLRHKAMELAVKEPEAARAVDILDAKEARKDLLQRYKDSLKEGNLEEANRILREHGDEGFIVGDKFRREQENIAKTIKEMEEESARNRRRLLLERLKGRLKGEGTLPE